METIKILFWVLLFIVFYAYFGYGIVLYGLVLIKRAIPGKKTHFDHKAAYEPEVTLFVAAYNEK
ncbi:MAG: glycosyl transferase, partial [Bacteroidetes bacterium CG_4_10_14_3_um_filter_42_6]